MSNIDHLDLDGYTLRTFLTVLDETSVSRGAERLGVSQSAVSHTLRIRYQDDLLHIHVEGKLGRDWIHGAQERLDLLRLLLEKTIGEPLVVKFEVIPVDILNFQSPREIETTAGFPLPENHTER